MPAAANSSASRSVETVAGPLGDATRRRATSTHFGVFRCGRPHLKTPKCVEVARRLVASPKGPATVSTLREAEEFAAAGMTNLLYAVGIGPAKLDRVMALHRKGVDLTVVLDSVAAAEAVAARSRTERLPIPVLIEVDSDGHRAGVRPTQKSLLLDIARTLHEGGAALRGVMTHAGS